MAQLHHQFKLRPFQERSFKAVMQGQSVILQAPTGAGKTRAALAPFLQNLANSLSDPTYQSKLPLTCRYAVPLRVLASQFFKDFEFCNEKLGRTTGVHLKAIYDRFNQQPVQLQTGEQPDDPQLESALTFCTIDQLLASFLAIPYSLGQRRANINVGGVIGSYLVLDEFHLYPLTRGNNGCWGARTTALQMLRMLRINEQRLTPFVLMTATFSSHLLAELSMLLNAVIVDVPSNELTPLNAGRERRFTVHNTPMNAQTVLDQHVDCSLVVCNTVLRAQQMFQALRQHVARDGGDIQLILLHSRFTDGDRKRQQEVLETALGEGAWEGDIYHGPNIIVVATQVVEVGLNISARTLHTEAAPANSVIQRAGRCARFKEQRGHVHLYPIPPNERGNVVFLPYDEQTSNATLQAFARFDGQHVGFTEEQMVIDAVHTENDAALLQAFNRECSLIHGKMYEGFSAHNSSIISSLIRDVQQTTLLIHDDPKVVITERPWEWETFSLHPGTLESRWEILQEVASVNQQWGEEGHVAWQAKLDSTIVQEENERRPTRYTWESLTTSAQIRSSLIVALSPTIATYDPHLGLVLRDGRLTMEWPQTPFRSRRLDNRRRQREAYTYDQESYAEHIGGLFNAYRESRLSIETAYIAQQLEQALSLSPGAIDQAIRLAIACHDIGKLGIGWQDWAKGWQTLLVQTYAAQAEVYRPQKYPFAHTDYEGRIHRDLERSFKTPRPNHACESAYLAAPLIEASLGNKRLAQATVAAIARHHSPKSQSYERTQLIPNARTYVQEMLDRVARGQRWTYDIEHLDDVIDDADTLTADEMTIPRRDIEAEMWLYFVIVRVLRLADGRSFTFRD